MSRHPTFPSDLSTPGAIDRLLAAHRSAFGDLRMEGEEDPPGENGGDGEQEQQSGEQPAEDPPHGKGFPADTPLSEMSAEQQAAYWKHQSRQHEARAKSRADYDDVKAKADRLDEIERENESEKDKAVREAREEGRTEALRASYDGTAKALLRMGLKARGVSDDDLDEIVTQANLAAFADEDGDVDDEKISRYVARNAGTASTERKWPGTGQDRRGGGPQKESGDDLWEKHYGSKKK